MGKIFVNDIQFAKVFPHHNFALQGNLKSYFDMTNVKPFNQNNN